MPSRRGVIHRQCGDSSKDPVEITTRKYFAVSRHLPDSLSDPISYHNIKID